MERGCSKMTRIAVVFALLSLVLAGGAVAQDEEAPTVQKITGPHNPFTLLLPMDWKFRAFESVVEEENVKTERAVYVFGDKMLPTDNFDLWWSAVAEPTIATGAASVHRVVLAEPLTPEALPALLEKDPRKPPNTKGELKQLGKYMALVAKANLEGFVMSSVYIVNGKVMYLGFINGPEALVNPKMEGFIKIMSSLEAPDVAPVKPAEPPAAPAE